VTFWLVGPDHLDTGHRYADADQAKETGGMVALYPRADDADKLAVPGGEPPEDLHVTLVYLGEDVSDLDPTDLYHALDRALDTTTVITARILGHALFNPDGGVDGEQEPCAVYLISDAEQLDELHTAVLAAAQDTVPQLHAQHKPWIPHITAGYDLSPGTLSYTGPILFDRVGLDFAGQTHFFPLMGATNTY
jgi:2'-5' RNA ligase